MRIDDKKTSIEKDLEKLFCKRILKEGGLAIKLVPWSIIGLPDRMALRKPGRVDFVEFKDEGLPLRATQIKTAERMEKLGFKVHLINSYTSLNAFFE